jgi:methylated-DNA-[protein]-cysteine S-methyltransferase
MTRKASVDKPLYTGQIKNTPLGDFWLAASDLGLVAVHWADTPADLEAYLAKRFKRAIQPDDSKTAEAAGQIREYLAGERREFSLDIDWSLLRPFQREVLQFTFAIPYGETRTYSEIAQHIGRPRAARAVGRAQATNPMPLVIPCHRVIGLDGKLHGYGAGEGLPTKEWLLKMEGAVMA